MIADAHWHLIGTLALLPGPEWRDFRTVRRSEAVSTLSGYRRWPCGTTDHVWVTSPTTSRAVRLDPSGDEIWCRATEFWYLITALERLEPPGGVS